MTAVTIDLTGSHPRRCGECTACCRILPIKGLKKANTRCPHQFSKGCRIYARRPNDCRLWSCRWLLGLDTEGMRRPDRSGYVIDALPDVVQLRDDATGQVHVQEVVQVWVDPARPDSWREPAMIAYIERRGAEGFLTLLRFSEDDAMAVVPRSMNNGAWVEYPRTRNVLTHAEHARLKARHYQVGIEVAED